MVRTPLGAEQRSNLSILLWMLLMVLLGVGLIALAFCVYAWGCPHADAVAAWHKAAVCDPIRQSPPWVLFPAVAAAPAVLLTWFWRTAQRERDLLIAHDGQVTDRYATAVGLLAKKDEDESILGGIYLLERVARDSSTDVGIVIEQLSAFVRHHSPWNEDDEETAWLSTPVQTALTVLGRLPTDGRSGTRIDLRGASLNRAVLNGNFEDALFDETLLRKTSFRGARIAGARFRSAWLDETDFDGVIGQEEADFSEVRNPDSAWAALARAPQPSK